MEKAAFKVVTKPDEPLIVEPDMLEELIGTPRFSSKRIYDKTPAGVVAGLAYNEVGGSILYIEAQRSNFKEGTGGLKVTGKLGDVMQESSQIACTYAKNFINERFSDDKLATFLDEN